jgi:hypothetical protein
MAAVDQSAVKKYNCDVMTVLIYQHNMDCIKTEPDPDDEVHLASCSENQLVDMKQEEQPFSISFPPAVDGSDVSCQCVCCYWHAAPAGDLFGICV